MSKQAHKGLMELFALAPVIPVITIENVVDAIPLARALVAGGLRVVEITLRTNAAMEAARAIVAEVPEAVVGIGSVLAPNDLEQAATIGAAFAISPGQSPELLDAAAAGDLPFAPGIQTPSDLTACLGRGFDLVKFFPAMPAGGLATLNALAGPFPSIRYCPTGGISAGNAAQWLAHPKVVAVGGSWVAPAGDVKAGAWSAIEQRARAAAALRRQGRGVGMLMRHLLACTGVGKLSLRDAAPLRPLLKRLAGVGAAARAASRHFRNEVGG